MRKLFLFFFSVTFLFVTCGKNNSELLNQPIESVSRDYFIDYHSVEDFSRMHCLNTRGASSSVSPFSFRNETVFYIVNYPDNQGWQIVSSDRRTPAILAESSQGHFSMETDNVSLYSWMMGVAEDLYAVRHSKNTDLSFSEDEIAAHVSFWSREPTRSLDPQPGDEGYWSASVVSTVTEVVDSITHLTTTQWTQQEPYNQYCPLTTDGLDHAPAGCIAVAGAQMLYYLHDKWGIPQYMVSSASCSGYVGNYNMCQWNPTSTVWDEMIEVFCPGGCLHTHPESVMIAHVGTLLRSEYGNDGTSADLEDLVEDVFNLFGINCNYGTYSESAVKNSLITGYPVIVGASSQWYPNWDFTIPSHSFLIDGYKRTRIKTTTHYTFIPYDPNNYELGSHPSYDVITYSTPEITSVKMNWGWWTQWYLSDSNPTYKNDDWFTLTGDWVVDQDGDQVNYHYYRKMINDFSIIE